VSQRPDRLIDAIDCHYFYVINRLFRLVESRDEELPELELGGFLDPVRAP
jgi:hypothetical protein